MFTFQEHPNPTLPPVPPRGDSANILVVDDSRHGNLTDEKYESAQECVWLFVLFCVCVWLYVEGSWIWDMRISMSWQERVKWAWRSMTECLGYMHHWIWPNQLKQRSAPFLGKKNETLLSPVPAHVSDLDLWNKSGFEGVSPGSANISLAGLLLWLRRSKIKMLWLML